MKTINTICGGWRWIVCLMWYGFVLGCSTAPTAPTAQPVAPDRLGSGTTVVCPFVDMANIYGDNASGRNPITSKIFVTDIVEEKAALNLTHTLYRLIGRETGLKWGRVKEAPSVQEWISADGPFGEETHHRKALQEMGRREGADNIMIGFLYAFRDRAGGDYGVEKPAQVAFELVLIHTDTGRLIWQRSYKETQKSLSEDLLRIKTFIKRKGRWISAQEMAGDALKEMLRTISPPESHNNPTP